MAVMLIVLAVAAIVTILLTLHQGNIDASPDYTGKYSKSLLSR